MKKWLLVLVFSVATACASGQAVDSAYSYNPDNAASLQLKYMALNTLNPVQLNDVKDYFALVQLGYARQKGGFKEYSVPGTINVGNIHSTGYRKVNNLSLFGSFDYKIASYNDMQYNSSLYTSYNNPFKIGDSSLGNYDVEDITIKAGMASAVKKLEWGIFVNYKTIRGADQTDPRPDIKAVRFNITPGVKYNFSNWYIGVSGKAEKYKENISYTVLNTSLPHNYYLFKGLGTYYPNSGNGYTRNYLGDNYTGSIQAGYQGSSFENLLELGYTNLLEKAEDGSATNLFKGGDFLSNKYFVQNISKLRRDKTSHILRLYASSELNDGTWYDQMQVVNAQKLTEWLVFNKSIVFQFDEYTGGLAYTFLKEKYSWRGFSASAGVRYTTSKTLLFPDETFMKYVNLLGSLVINKNFQTRNEFIINTQLDIGYNKNLSRSYDFYGIELKDKVTLPQFYFLSNNWAGGSVKITVSKSLKAKASKLLPFVSLQYDTKNSLNDNTYFTSADRNTKSIAVGILF